MTSAPRTGLAQHCTCLASTGLAYHRTCLAPDLTSTGLTQHSLHRPPPEWFIVTWVVAEEYCSVSAQINNVSKHQTDGNGMVKTHVFIIIIVKHIINNKVVKNSNFTVYIYSSTLQSIYLSSYLIHLTVYFICSQITFLLFCSFIKMYVLLFIYQFYFSYYQNTATRHQCAMAHVWLL